MYAMPRKKISDPIRFSSYFKLSPGLLRKRGAFDPILNSDTRLFIDPLLLSRSAHKEARAAHRDWSNHFRDIIKLLKVAKDQNDPPWRAAERMFEGREFHGTCLGYGSGTIKGSGIGVHLRRRMMRTAQRIVELGVEDPELFALLPLLEEDLGSDRISDLTTQVIGPRLAEFTTSALAGLEVPTAEFDIGGRTYELPINPLVTSGRKPIPVVLTPLDVLRTLPIAEDWDGIADAASHNSSLRRELNERIGQLWERQVKKDKAKVRAAVLDSREAVEAMLNAVHASDAKPYDLATDPEGVTSWLERGQELAARAPLRLSLASRDVAGVTAVVEQIIGQFRYIIEDAHGWRQLYAPNGKLLREAYAQRLFFAVADSYCKANDVDLTPEANQGAGPVDFKMSKGYASRVLVELKYSDNSRLHHGYVKQLEKYKRGERTGSGFYLVLDVGRGQSQVAKVTKAESTARAANAPHSQVRLVDARRQKSASKS